jgi:hypothetical protein
MNFAAAARRASAVSGVPFISFGTGGVEWFAKGQVQPIACSCFILIIES